MRADMECELLISHASCYPNGRFTGWTNCSSSGVGRWIYKIRFLGRSAFASIGCWFRFCENQSAISICLVLIVTICWVYCRLNVRWSWAWHHGVIRIGYAGRKGRKFTRSNQIRCPISDIRITCLCSIVSLNRSSNLGNRRNSSRISGLGLPFTRIHNY